jgi:formyltetrahydrofolate deformylase
LNSNKSNASAILLIHCPDRKGLVLSVTEFIHTNEGNIIYLDQHVDHQNKVFFMRIEWDLTGFLIPSEKIAEYFQVLIAKKFNMNWQLHFSDSVPRMAVFVSKFPHCLYDIIARWQSAEWNVEIPLIISNHNDLRPIAEKFGIEYLYLPKDKKNKIKQESKELQLLKEYRIDFVVLARYMQILSENFISNYDDRIINIHHSFLPAFPGAKPYHSAFERGVKIIGSTSHYVTSDLDAGPIIEQDVARVSHTDSVKDLIRKGIDLEKIVLSRAIWKHLQRKILVYNNRTVIFA